MSILWAMVRLKVSEPAAISQLASRFKDLLPQCSPGESGAALLALSYLGGAKTMLGPAFMSEYVRAAMPLLAPTAALGTQGGRELALLMYGLYRWAGRSIRPRRHFLRLWARASAPHLHEWAPRDVAMGALGLGQWRDWGDVHAAWVGAAMRATMQPELLVRINGADATGLLAGFAGLQGAAEARDRAAGAALAAEEARRRVASLRAGAAADGGAGRLPKGPVTGAQERDGGASGSVSDGVAAGVADSSSFSRNSSSSGVSSSGNNSASSSLAEAPGADVAGSTADDSSSASAVVCGELGSQWWAAYQAATLVLLPTLALSNCALMLTSVATLRLEPSPEWVRAVGSRGLELAAGAAAKPRTHGAACLLLVALSRAVVRMAPGAAADARRALAPGVVSVATALAPHLDRTSNSLDLVQIITALARLGVRPGPAFAAAHARGVERVSHTLTTVMWRQVRDGYAALRLAPSNAMVRAFIVHLG